jgi:hypothetical protein
MIMADTESNNSLYFIVGGLVVLAILGGFLMWPGDRVAPTSSTTYNTVAPAGGTETQSDETRVEFDDEGNAGSVTRTQTETNQQ